MTDSRQWTGKTGGGSFGQKFLFGFLKKVRVSFLYPVLYLIIPFYLLFGRKGYKAMMSFFHEHLGKTRWQAFWATVKNHIIFGQVVLDKFALLAGNTSQFKVSVDNLDIFNQAIDLPSGFITVSAHIGNFEAAGLCLHQDKKELNGVVYGGETQAFSQHRAEAFQKSHLKLIPVSNDMSHLFAIKSAVENGEIVTLHGDRLWGSPKYFSCNFLGSEAHFPIGTFRLATQMEAPVFAVFIMKEKGLSYHGYVYRLNHLENEKSSVKKAEYIGRQYVEKLEETIRKYPEQWFNYYDFWSKA